MRSKQTSAERMGRVHGAPTFITVRGIVHEPTTKLAMSRESYDVLLAAIAKARGVD
jgi:hypothetical protein